MVAVLISLDVVACMAASATATRSFPFVSAYMGVPSSRPISSLGHEFLGCQKTPSEAPRREYAARDWTRATIRRRDDQGVSRNSAGRLGVRARASARASSPARRPSGKDRMTERGGPRPDGIRLDRGPPRRLEHRAVGRRLVARPIRSPARTESRRRAPRDDRPYPRERCTIRRERIPRVPPGIPPAVTPPTPTPRADELGAVPDGDTILGDDRPPVRPERSRDGSASRTAGPDRPRADRDPRANFPARGMCWRGSASSTSWDAGRSPASTWPRRSIWGGDSSPSRSLGPRGTSRGSSPGSSTRTSCRSIRCATTARRACACSACRISAAPTSPRCSKRRADC